MITAASLVGAVIGQVRCTRLCAHGCCVARAERRAHSHSLWHYACRRAVPCAAEPLQIAFGVAADQVGRRVLFLVTSFVVASAALGSALIFEADWSPLSIYGQLIAWRFVLGIGVGGEYPLSAAHTAENRPRAGDGDYDVDLDLATGAVGAREAEHGEEEDAAPAEEEAFRRSAQQRSRAATRSSAGSRSSAQSLSSVSLDDDDTSFISPRSPAASDERDDAEAAERASVGG